MSSNIFALNEFQPIDVFSRKIYIHKLNFSGQNFAKIFAENPRIHSDIRNRSSFISISNVVLLFLYVTADALCQNI